MQRLKDAALKYQLYLTLLVIGIEVETRPKFSRPKYNELGRSSVEICCALGLPGHDALAFIETSR